MEASRKMLQTRPEFVICILLVTCVGQFYICKPNLPVSTEKPVKSGLEFVVEIEVSKSWVVKMAYPGYDKIFKKLSFS